MTVQGVQVGAGRQNLRELELLVGVEVAGAAADPAGDVPDLGRGGDGGRRGHPAQGCQVGVDGAVAAAEAQRGDLPVQLLDVWIENRDNMNTATNRDSRWLFPGAGRPADAPRLARRRLQRSRHPTVTDQASAIRQHVLEMPAPVVADALGYHQVTTAKLAAQTGGTWSRYAA